MARVSKTAADAGPDRKTPRAAHTASRIRRTNRIKDEVYREMLRLEANRPGAEMGVALALLQAVVHAQDFPNVEGFGEWLKHVCPLGLRMIEASLARGSKCETEPC